MHPKKIKATYKNGVIKPLDKINLPEGQALEIQIKTLPSVTSELSRDQKRELIQKTRGSVKAPKAKALGLCFVDRSVSEETT